MMEGFVMGEFNRRDYVLCNQCIKKGWLNRSRPELIDDSTDEQNIYDELNKLGLKYYGGDLNIVFEGSLMNTVSRTAKEISKGIRVIGTPYFALDGMSCRPSLIKQNGDSYDLVQVVDTTEIKEETISGVSYMTFVIEESGLLIKEIYILYINSSYERGKELDVRKFFIEECITEKVRQKMFNIASNISLYRDALQSVNQPIVDIGENCDKTKCPYSAYCREELNIPANTIFDISGRFLKPSKKYNLYNQGIVTFEDIVSNMKMAKLSENAMKQVIAEYEDKHIINKENLKAFVSSISYPIYHLDFESFTQTIPLYEGIRPYQQICFQYSLHIEQENGFIEHREYLAQEGCNPIKDFVEHLCDDLPTDVTVMVYNKVFEYIKDGSLGKLRLIDVEFGTRKEYDETNRFYSPDLAGGTMLDIGVYALSFVRYFLSETASEIKSSAQLAPTGVDEQGIILLSNSRGEMASVLLSFVAKLPRVAVASFENGFVEFDNFNRSCKATITLFDARQPIVITSDTSVSPLLYEARDMEEAVLGGENKMRLNLTRDVMDIMTKLRYDWGVRYPEEIEN